MLRFRSRLDNISKLSRNTSRAARNTTATTSRSTRGILSRKTAAAKSTLKKPDIASKASTDQKKANEKKVIDFMLLRKQWQMLPEAYFE